MQYKRRKHCKGKRKSTRNFTLKIEKGKIGTQQRNKVRDSNILKCKSKKTTTDITNSGSNISEVWGLIKKEI